MCERILAIATLVGMIALCETARSEPIVHKTECRWVNEPIILREGSQVRYYYPGPASIYDPTPPVVPYPKPKGIWYWLFGR